ncbi:hypothetical protein ACLOJK_037727 [Asimina triloba]
MATPDQEAEDFKLKSLSSLVGLMIGISTRIDGLVAKIGIDDWWSISINKVPFSELLQSMVFSTRCGCNAGFDDMETLPDEYDSNFFSRKRAKMLASGTSDYEECLCIGKICEDALPLHPHMEGSSPYRSSSNARGHSSICNPIERAGVHVAMDRSCESVNNSSDAAHPCSTGGNGFLEHSCAGYAQATLVSGWMYTSQCGQMCGPYIQEQLLEGLSTGFLPEDLHVYPFVNGNLGNPVPLKYFKQFPDHVATGFAYLTSSIPATIVSGIGQSANCQLIPCHRESVPTLPKQESMTDYALPVTIGSKSQSQQPLSSSAYGTQSSGPLKGYMDATNWTSQLLLLACALPLCLGPEGPLYLPVPQTLACNQVRIPVGHLRMAMAEAMGHIHLQNFSFGIKANWAERTKKASTNAIRIGEWSCQLVMPIHCRMVLADEEPLHTEKVVVVDPGKVVVIAHVGNKVPPVALLSMINGWRTTGPLNFAAAENKCDTSFLSFISDISEEVSSQLHSGVMKAARRVVLDEIISGIIPEFYASKKAEKSLKPDIGNQTVMINSLANKKPEPVRKRKKIAASRSNVAVNICAESISVGHIHAKSMAPDQSAVSIENFYGIFSKAREMVFDSCMQVMWNAIFFEPVADYASAWRKRKRWSGDPLLPIPSHGIGEGRLSKKSVHPSAELAHGEVETEVGCPPGFGTKVDIYEPLTLRLQNDPSSEVDIPEQIRIARSSQILNDIKAIQDSVERAIYSSVEMFFFEYLEEVIQREVSKSFNSSPEYGLNVVSLYKPRCCDKLLACISSLPIFMLFLLC